MPDFTISHANSLRFRIETGTGSINDGATNIPNNYLFCDVKTYFNSECCMHLGPAYFQKYEITDTSIRFQIDYNNSGFNPRPLVKDKDGNTIAVLEATAGGIGTQTNYTLDFTATYTDNSAIYAVAECYYVEIWSDLIGNEETGNINDNLFTQGDFGRHEAAITNLVTGIGATLNNTLAQSAVQFNAGANSVLITAPGTTTADHKLVYANAKTSLITLVTGSTYQAIAYVYNDSSAPFVNTESLNLLVNFQGGFGDDPAQAVEGWTDAVIHTQGTLDATTQDVFTEIKTIFTVGTDTTGSLVITSDDIPTAAGFLYVDSVSISIYNNVLEATSEPIQLAANWDCHQKITWTNSNAAHNIYYSSGDLIHTAYVNLNYHRFRMGDESEVVYDDDDGASQTLTINAQYITILETGEVLPLYMLEKLILAMKHQTFTINGVQYVAREGDMTPSFENATFPMGSLSTELNLSPYKYQNSNC